MFDHIQKWEQTTLSQQAYCKEKGINAKSEANRLPIPYIMHPSLLFIPFAYSDESD